MTYNVFGGTLNLAQSIIAEQYDYRCNNFDGLVRQWHWTRWTYRITTLLASY